MIIMNSTYKIATSLVGTSGDATKTFGLTGATLGVILGTLSSALMFGTAVILCTIIGGVLLVKRKGMPINNNTKTLC